MDTERNRADLVAAYDANADARDVRGEPEWRDVIRSDFAARLPSGGAVLEIGAGTGYTARWLHDHGFDVTATDLSPAHVDKIRAKGVKAEVRDMTDLGFDPGSFDGVWAASCLMHLPDSDLRIALAEIHDVLRPDGWFWAGTWGGQDHEGPWEDDTHEPKRFYALRSHERIQRFYRATGFEVVSFEVLRPEKKVAWDYQSALMRRLD